MIKEKANQIHFNSIVLDCHNDTMLAVVDPDTGLPKIDIGKDTDLQIDLHKAKKGGLDVGYFAAFSDRKESYEKANSNILALINALYWTQDHNQDTLEIATTVEKIKNILSTGKMVAVPTIEGAYSLGEDNAIELLNQYYDLGVRVVAYVWNTENALGAGTEGPEDMGLTQLGYQVTDEMNRLGMIIDVSHMNEKTFWDVVKYSKAPIIASHSCSSKLCPHVRNLTDEQIIALAKNKGLININYWWQLLGQPKEDVDVKKLVDHIDYVVRLVGIDYVGLGSDFDGASMPVDIQTVEDLPKITLELLERNYTEEDIKKILGLNNLRVMEEVQKMAKVKRKNNIKIIPNIKPGSIIGNEEKLLKAKINRRNVKEADLDFRIIVDGIEYKSKYSKEEKILCLDENINLAKNSFHVITFEVKDHENNISRSTCIFYCQNTTEL